jgi:hypothetical protein
LLNDQSGLVLGDCTVFSWAGCHNFEGAIDEGEVNEEDSSDDEDDPLVPRDWDSYNFSQLSVNAGENVAWSIEKMQFLLAPCIRVQ